MIEFNLEAKLAQEAASEQYKKDLEKLKKEYDVKFGNMISEGSIFSKYYTTDYTNKFSTKAGTWVVVDDISTN